MIRAPAERVQSDSSAASPTNSPGEPPFLQSLHAQNDPRRGSTSLRNLSGKQPESAPASKSVAWRANFGYPCATFVAPLRDFPFGRANLRHRIHRSPRIVLHRTASSRQTRNRSPIGPIRHCHFACGAVSRERSGLVSINTIGIPHVRVRTFHLEFQKMNFETLGLAPALLRALADQGYTEPTPIQTAAIPVALDGRDLLAGAQTGTGKTAAFALPLLDRMYVSSRRASQPKTPRALVLTPTRELAAQVHESMRTYGRHLGVKSATVFGGVGMPPQVDALRRGVEILVATPGRLIDHIERRSVNLSGIEVLVLDEADRMLDMGFMPAIKRILGTLPRQRITWLFSATFAPEIKALASQFMRDPVEIQVVEGKQHRANGHASRASGRCGAQARPAAAPARKRRAPDARVRPHQARRRQTRQDAGEGRPSRCRDPRQQEPGSAHARTRGFQERQGRRARRDRYRRARPRHRSAADGDQFRTADGRRGLHSPYRPHRPRRREGLAISLVSHDEESRLRDIRRLLKQDIAIEPVAGFETTHPLRLDGPVSRAGPSRSGTSKKTRLVRRRRGIRTARTRTARAAMTPRMPRKTANTVRAVRRFARA